MISPWLVGLVVCVVWSVGAFCGWEAHRLRIARLSRDDLWRVVRRKNG